MLCVVLLPVSCIVHFCSSAFSEPFSFWHLSFVCSCSLCVFHTLTWYTRIGILARLYFFCAMLVCTVMCRLLWSLFDGSGWHMFIRQEAIWHCGCVRVFCSALGVDSSATSATLKVHRVLVAFRLTVRWQCRVSRVEILHVVFCAW